MDECHYLVYKSNRFECLNSLEDSQVGVLHHKLLFQQQVHQHRFQYSLFLKNSPTQEQTYNQHIQDF